MTLRKRIVSLGAAFAIAVSMLSVGASASTAYNFKLQRTTHYQPVNTVVCSGNVTNLSSGVDWAIDFYCTSKTGTGSGKFDISHNMKYDLSQYAYLHVVNEHDDILFKSGWYSAYVSNGYKCAVNGEGQNPSDVFELKGYAL